MSGSLFAELFATLDIVVMERTSAGLFHLVGSAPDWCQRIYCEVASVPDSLRPGDRFPFLENFLVDAEHFWLTHSAGQLKSGPWRDLDALGYEHYLEATAVCLGKRKLLLLAFPEMEYEEKQTIIQKARENSLAYTRFNKELQQKEVLLHCIIHDLSGPLTAIMFGLSILASEKLTATGQKAVESCMLQASRQKALIQQILDVFAAEARAFEPSGRDPAHAPDMVLCAQAVVDALRPSSVRNQITLQLAPGRNVAADWRVVGEASRLERVIFNLVDNALRHSPVGSTVTVGMRADAADVLVTVDDEGPGIQQELIGSIFEKFSQARAQPGKAGLGLYFCRITIESWGGSIGYNHRATGGAQFWFRLPHSVDVPLLALQRHEGGT